MHAHARVQHAYAALVEGLAAKLTVPPWAWACPLQCSEGLCGIIADWIGYLLGRRA